MSLQPIKQSKWTNFPGNYRVAEVKEIAKWILPGESGVVIGGSGSGKSNIAGYIANRPDVINQYLPKSIDDYYIIHFDANTLPVVTTVAFYRSLLYTLATLFESDDELTAKLSAIVEKAQKSDDSLSQYFALQQAHKVILASSNKNIVWLLDRFDNCCTELDTGVLNSLRHLRDQFKDRLSYVAFTRFPLSRLRNPRTYSELYDLLIMHTCWVGPMTSTDSRWVAHQVEMRYSQKLDEFQINTLFQLCGGSPTFLKLACTALVQGKLEKSDRPNVWLLKLLELESIQESCRELWATLSTEEQLILKECLSSSESDTQESQQSKPVSINRKQTNYLEGIGVLDSHLHFLSRIFEEFVRRQGGQTPENISIQNHIVYRGSLPLTEQPTPTEFRVLECLLFYTDAGYANFTQLYRYVYPHEKLESNDIQHDMKQKLAQQVGRLNKKLTKGLEPEWEYVQNRRTAGYQLVQPSPAAN
ncbi:MAG: helix-turn-helix domain-containing protein [Caldilineaceae bacterium]